MARGRRSRYRSLGSLIVATAGVAGLVGCASSSPRKPAETTSTTAASSLPSRTGSAPTPASLASPPSPIRAAFYYPWFPEAWAQQGQNPFTNYQPARGFYRTDAATVRAQIAEMQYGDISIGIASWFGPGTTTDRHWPALIAGARGSGFAWAPYYEPEGVSDPSPIQIGADLEYLHLHYGGSGLARVGGGAMPVFVYNADDLTRSKGCDTLVRWTAARELVKAKYGFTIYVDLKVFPQYRSCPGAAAIDGWHQYEPASATQDFSSAPGAGSYSISPGYWKSGAAYGVAPFLMRDRVRWRSSIASMRASGAHWQLITTYNEWGEGTAVESASACRSPTPSGTYCDWRVSGASQFMEDLHAAPPG